MEHRHELQGSDCMAWHHKNCMIAWDCMVQVVLPLGEVPDKRAGKNPEQDSEQYPPGGPCTTSVTGEVVCIRRRPDLEAVRRCVEVSKH